MSSPHILVVDDEADIRGLLKEILSEEGYEVDVAANAAQARASRARQMPDLVLLDIWMPDVDGITLLREWSVGPSDGCPVVMMSGHSTVETAVEATRLGAFDFVEKPLSLAKLLRTVERALDAGRRHRQSGKLSAPRSRCRSARAASCSSCAPSCSRSPPIPRRCCWSASPARDARPSRATCTSIARARSALRAAHRQQPARCGCRGAPVRPRGGRRHQGAGVLEEAGNGTLFIHEIEDLPPSAQRLLVGVFESGQFTRLGGREPLTFAPACCPRRSRASSSALAARPAA